MDIADQKGQRKPEEEAEAEAAWETASDPVGRCQRVRALSVGCHWLERGKLGCYWLVKVGALCIPVVI